MAPTFRTNNGMARFAWEDPLFPGYPKPVPDWKDFRLRSESLALQIARVPIGNLSPGNQPQPGLLSNITIAGDFDLRWEPTVHPLFLCNFQKGEKTVVDLAGVAATGVLTLAGNP